MSYKKILHITTVPLTLKFLTGHFKAQQDAGYQVICITSKGKIPSEVSDVLKNSPKYVSFVRSIKPYKDFVAFISLFKLIKTEKPVLVNVHTPKASLLGIIVCKILRIPCVYHLHGIRYITSSGLKRTILKFMEKVSCNLASKVLSVSRTNKKYLTKDGICQKEKIKVLGNGSISGINVITFTKKKYSKNQLDNFYKNNQIPINSIVIGFVGRLVRDKGIEQLYRVWMALKTHYPQAVLICAGEWEKEDPIDSQLMQSIINEPSIKLLGFLEDVRIIYDVMSFLVFPSKREGFGMSILEANAFKKPCIASNIPGCQDAVANNESGILFDSLDDKDLLDKLIFYIDNPNVVKLHGDNAFRRLIKDFNPTTLEELLIKEYENLLD